ncbi:hypothetical protein [Nonomuraea jiangxiensis]|uniref:Uncharacterized protein n=1 Tax=Nonomuraea jiangxiensis TaxID=633440 RepID=A0A1G8BR23_9ACTN|nr:hypothetical protein [Nonomuraea jiangxiensis]SDH35655.1 hypothetical protein SAMN05421869_10297 [Nonomuraea jiangxiensis]
MTVVSFLAPSSDALAGGQSVAAAVGRFLDQVQAATTRAGYAAALTRLTALAGTRPTASLRPED